jgi:hypothetical protein
MYDKLRFGRIMTLVDNYIGLETPKLTVPTNLEPTWSGRGWIIHPLGNVGHFIGCCKMQNGCHVFLIPNYVGRK